MCAEGTCLLGLRTRLNIHHYFSSINLPLDGAHYSLLSAVAESTNKGFRLTCQSEVSGLTRDSSSYRVLCNTHRMFQSP